MDEADTAALQAAGWMLREGVQFHWTQREEAPWGSFDEFLHSLQREKRKKIAQEQRRVAEAGVHFTVHEGGEITEDLWDFFYRCYTLTYQAHGSMPYLERAFFSEVARTMARHWLLFVARRGGEPIAASLIVLDPDRKRAFGRYWGSVEHVPCLHFDACYYQPLRWCVEHGYLAFEGGAQGEHKMARGLLPVRTQSAHWLADRRFAGAVADFLAREGAGVQDYVDELRAIRSRRSRRRLANPLNRPTPQPHKHRRNASLPCLDRLPRVGRSLTSQTPMQQRPFLCYRRPHNALQGRMQP
jgi:predicted N-acyltransferase